MVKNYKFFILLKLLKFFTEKKFFIIFLIIFRSFIRYWSYSRFSLLKAIFCFNSFLFSNLSNYHTKWILLQLHLKLIVVCLKTRRFRFLTTCHFWYFLFLNLPLGLCRPEEILQIAILPKSIENLSLADYLGTEILFSNLPKISGTGISYLLHISAFSSRSFYPFILNFR